MRSAGMPAASARRSSPSETTSTPAPSRAERLQDRLVGIGLHRVADHGVDAVERFGKDAVVAFERRRRIA